MNLPLLTIDLSPVTASLGETALQMLDACGSIFLIAIACGCLFTFARRFFAYFKQLASDVDNERHTSS